MTKVELRIWTAAYAVGAHHRLNEWGMVTEPEDIHRYAMDVASKAVDAYIFGKEELKRKANGPETGS